jgi:hypothetical protein
VTRRSGPSFADAVAAAPQYAREGQDR